MNEIFISVLKKAGQSITKPRKDVFITLQENGPLTMQSLCKIVAASIDRSSVYRTVALFESLGIITRVNHGWKYQVELTDAFTPHHHHLTCSKCKKSFSFDEPKGLDGMLHNIGKENDFKVISHTLEIQGLCKDCD